jgi:hypothetical protein
MKCKRGLRKDFCRFKVISQIIQANSVPESFSFFNQKREEAGNDE